jgi:SAM-dependent methyltransferase
MESTVPVVPTKDFDYYTDPVYWTSFLQTQIMQNELISGEPYRNWILHFDDRYGPCKAALFPTCGNGWVERWFFEAGVIESVVGIDIGAAALAVATEEARKIGMPAVYSCTDINDFRGTDEPVDVVVNNGSMHHVAYIDRVTRNLRRSLRPGGYYVLADYVGPHRNQYSWEVWKRMLEFTATLPEKYRRRIQYPHLRTMLAEDATEAVHSELQFEVLQRYFDVVERVDLGGGIAYPFMFQHHALFADRDTEEGIAVVNATLEADRRALAEMPQSNLFSFCVATPRDPALDDPAQLAAWTAEEDAREERARQNGGRYHDVDALELIYDWIADLLYEKQMRPPPAA